MPPFFIVKVLSSRGLVSVFSMLFRIVDELIFMFLYLIECR